MGDDGTGAAGAGPVPGAAPAAAVPAPPTAVSARARPAARNGAFARLWPPLLPLCRRQLRQERGKCLWLGQLWSLPPEFRALH